MKSSFRLKGLVYLSLVGVLSVGSAYAASPAQTAAQLGAQAGVSASATASTSTTAVAPISQRAEFHVSAGDTQAVQQIKILPINRAKL